MLRTSRLWLPFFAGLLLTGGATNTHAQLAARKADEWVTTLEGPQRIATQKIDQVLFLHKNSNRVEDFSSRFLSWRDATRLHC